MCSLGALYGWWCVVVGLCAFVLICNKVSLKHKCLTFLVADKEPTTHSHTHTHSHPECGWCRNEKLEKVTKTRNDRMRERTAYILGDTNKTRKKRRRRMREEEKKSR